MCRLPPPSPTSRGSRARPANYPRRGSPTSRSLPPKDPARARQTTPPRMPYLPIPTSRGSRPRARLPPPSRDSPPYARGSRARRARPPAAIPRKCRSLRARVPHPTRAGTARTSCRHAAPYAHACRAWSRAIRQPTPQSHHQLVPLLTPFQSPAQSCTTSFPRPAPFVSPPRPLHSHASVPLERKAEGEGACPNTG
jgi:hypothetical protein